MLKISVTNQSSEATNFQLEGKLVGPWVEELRRLSDAALMTSEAVSLDLEKVWFVDSQGIVLLRDLAKRHVAQINLHVEKIHFLFPDLGSSIGPTFKPEASHAII